MARAWLYIVLGVLSACSPVAPKKHKVCSMRDKDGNLKTTLSEIANVFADFYESLNATRIQGEDAFKATLKGNRRCTQRNGKWQIARLKWHSSRDAEASWFRDEEANGTDVH